MLDYIPAFPVHVYALSLASLAFLHAVIIIYACIYMPFQTVPPSPQLQMREETAKRRASICILLMLSWIQDTG